jgi:sporulation protein YlmC with PRC-barrel domain
MVNNDAERAAAPSAMYEAEIANIQGRKVGQMSETKIHQRRF